MSKPLPKNSFLLFIVVITLAWCNPAVSEIENNSKKIATDYSIALLEYYAKQNIPKKLPEHTINVEGIQFRFYGYTHGIVRLPKKYEQFVYPSINEEIIKVKKCGSQCAILVEQNLVRVLPPSNLFVEVPDYNALGKKGMVIWGILQPFIYYIINGHNLFERELLRHDFDFSRNDQFSIFYNAKLDSMTLEQQRLLYGLRPVAEANRKAMENYLNGEFNFGDRMYNLRSLYMAGFLLGYAKSRNLNQVVFIVGAPHISEIFDYLDGEGKMFKESELFKKAFNDGKYFDPSKFESLSLSRYQLTGWFICFISFCFIALFIYKICRLFLKIIFRRP